MIRVNKIIKGVLSSVIFLGLLLTIAAPALADSYNITPNIGEYVYDQTGVGGTKVITGAVVQIIYAKGGTIHAPNSDGSPGGGDTLVDTETRTVGNIGGDGYFYFAVNGLTNGETIYVRVWNGKTLATATSYGDSPIQKVNNPLPNPPATWILKSFATTGSGNGGVVIIDTFEGTKAASASDPTSPSDSVKLYFALSGTNTKSDEPILDRHKPTSPQEGSYSMGIAYPALTTTDDNKKFRGFGGQYDKTIDLSKSDMISFYLKGDGNDTNVKIQLQDADGTNYSSANIAISKSDTAWKEYKVSVSSISTKILPGSTDGLDLTKIKEYQVVFPGTAASASTKNAILIDNIIATTVSTSDVVISSISPNPANPGQEVTIKGSNLDTDGKLEFTGGGVTSYIESKANATPIKSWSVKEITFVVPNTLSGKLNLKVITDAKKESNVVDFTVSGNSTNPTYNFPNPFNPTGGEITTIVFTPGTETSASIYIIDITGRIVGKVAWTSATSAQVTWNGKDYNGNILGDGVYLYRVAAGSKLLGRGKILIVNK